MLEEASGMQERGHRVTLLCPCEARIHAEAAKRGLPAVALPIARKNLAARRKVRGLLPRFRSEAAKSLWYLR